MGEKYHNTLQENLTDSVDSLEKTMDAESEGMDSFIKTAFTARFEEFKSNVNDLKVRSTTCKGKVLEEFKHDRESVNVYYKEGKRKTLAAKQNKERPSPMELRRKIQLGAFKKFLEKELCKCSGSDGSDNFRQDMVILIAEDCRKA